MKKLLLDDLRVDSFVTAPDPAMTGTVVAHVSGTTFCSTDVGMQSCNAGACGTSFDPQCETGGPSNICTRYAYTCGAEGTCAPGATLCGTCYGEATCDLQYGCGGTTQGPQIC